ncbi:PAAR domain-containing protein [Paracoccus sp. (in: a-proteobacteria)]|uniref:PAAR domain-containing protein n=1 Tax=Paracoccus sp. TaxID=267 RepID=UPI0028A24B53|nr:PAAR domain-containing protein [Paracoccus sp. (in: a-proteobacteria)]
MEPVARLGDEHDCPLHGINRISQVASRVKLDGKEVASVGDLTECGGTIITGSPVNKVDGRPVAHIGSKTSCGGLITTGAPSEKVRAG